MNGIKKRFTRDEYRVLVVIFIVFALFLYSIYSFDHPHIVVHEPIDQSENPLVLMSEDDITLDLNVIPSDFGVFRVLHQRKDGFGLLTDGKGLNVDFVDLPQYLDLSHNGKPCTAWNWQANFDVPLEQLGISGTLNPIFQEDGENQYSTFAEAGEILRVPMQNKSLSQESVDKAIFDINLGEKKLTRDEIDVALYPFPEPDSIFNDVPSSDISVAFYSQGTAVIKEQLRSALENNFIISSFYLDNKTALYTIARVEVFSDYNYWIDSDNKLTVVYDFISKDAYIQAPYYFLYPQQAEVAPAISTNNLPQKQGDLTLFILVIVVFVAIIFIKISKIGGTAKKSKKAHTTTYHYDDYGQINNEQKENYKKQFNTNNKNGPFWIND